MSSPTSIRDARLLSCAASAYGRHETRRKSLRSLHSHIVKRRTRTLSYPAFIVIFWPVTPRRVVLLRGYRRNTFTLVPAYKTKRRHNPEDRKHLRRRDSLRSEDGLT